MASPTEIETVILSCAATVMADVPENERTVLGASSDLYGGASPFDSMNLVSLIVDLEEKLHSKFGKTLALADERAMAQPVNPFSKVQTLTQYVHLLLSES
jgi:acyl carrier protein